MKYTFIVFFLISFYSNAQKIIYVKQDAVGLNNGTSWENAYKNLSQAIKAAPAKAELWIAKGTYTPISPDTTYWINKSMMLFGGFLGNESNKSNRDLTANKTILSGEGNTLANEDNYLSVLFIDNPSDSVIVDGFTIEKSKFGSYLTGAITSYTAKLKIENCVFENKMPTALGSQIIEVDSGSVIIKNSKFINNTSNYSGVIGSYRAPITIESCVFENNTSGTVLINFAAYKQFELKCYNTIFKNNYGEIHILSTHALFKDCIFENYVGNTYPIYVSGGDSIVVDACKFLNNQTERPWLYCGSGTIKNSIFKDGKDNAI